MSQYEMHLLLAISRGNFSIMSVISLELTIEEKKQRTTKQEPLFTYVTTQFHIAKFYKNPRKIRTHKNGLKIH